MVSKLIFFQKDPQGKERGRGYYYYRGNLIQKDGRKIPTWSKYDESLDGSRFHSQKKVINKNYAKRSNPHKADYNNSIKRRSKSVVGRKILGYY